MERLQIINGSNIAEVNIKRLVEKIWQRKLLFMVSLFLCLCLAYVYIKMATPIYEVKTSLLIDPSGKSRMLGDSKYVEGGVGLIETEKNLINEINIMKSFDIVEKTLEALEFDISYYSGNGFKTEEHYGYFPFVVEPTDSSAQLYGAPFQVEILSDKAYQLTIEAKEFSVSNPATNTIRKVERDFYFSKVYSFGQKVDHDYFHFVLKKPDYKVVMEDFSDKELSFKMHHLEGLTKSFMGKIEVNQLDIQASILTLSTSGPIVRKEVDFLKKLTENYIQSKLQERNQIAKNKESFIQNQLASIADSLAIAERSLEAFQRNTQAVNLTQTTTNALSQVQQLQTEKAQIELKIKYYNSQLQNLSDSTALDKIIAPSVVGINDPILTQDLLELKRLYSEKARIGVVQTSQSYEMGIVNNQIKNTTASLQENLKNLIQSSQLALSNINYRIAETQGRISQLPSNENRLLSYERKRTLYENLFNYLSQELAKTGIARAEDIPDIKILDEPRLVGSGPVAPQKKLILALGFLIGLIIPMGWIVAYDSFNETIEDIQDLEGYSGIPVAASIAHESNGSDIMGEDFAEWQVEESFRDLSASLPYLMPQGKNKQNVIGITSTIPGEGKSFCAVKLGISLAKGGKKVLLIDTDFRKPSMMTNGNGSVKSKDLSDYLREKVPFIDDILHTHSTIPNLHFIISDKIERNPPRLLSDSRLHGLIQKMKENYDYIIVDSPAIGLVSDYLFISKFINIHLFVLRRNLSKVYFLRDLDKLINKGNLRNVYLIFNDAMGKAFKYGYSNYEYH
jgi:tyrosine-protein kinase Etk/Wzc